jgi:hypothetical protein
MGGSGGLNGGLEIAGVEAAKGSLRGRGTHESGGSSLGRQVVCSFSWTTP